MARRKVKTGYGEGSLWEVGEGRFQCRYGMGDDQTTETFSAETVTAARAILADKVAAHRRHRGIAVDVETGASAATRTLSNLLDAWLANGDFRPGSRRSYVSRVKVVGDRLGGKRLADLTTFDLDAAYRRWTAEGMAPGTVRALHSTIRSALHQAARWHWPTKANAADVTLPKVTTKVEAIPTADLGRILAAARAKGGKTEILVDLLSATGARLGEVLGLYWSDFDLDGDRPQLHIRRQRTPQGYGPTKTASGVRDIDLAPELVARLKAAQGSPTAPVVDWAPSNADKAFARLCKNLGFVRADGRSLYTCHQLRHNVADHLVLVAQIPVPDAARILGHSDGGALLLKTYASRLDAANRPQVVVNW